MSDLEDGTRAAAIAAAEEPAPEDGTREERAGEPTAAASTPPTGGEATAGAQALGIQAGGEGAGSSTDPIAPRGGGIAVKASGLVEEIHALKVKQKAARDAKLQISRELRNAEKRKQRLKRKAKQLSNADLVAVMTLRASEKAWDRKDEEPAALLSPADDSDTGSLASTSTLGTGEGALSPAKPKKKAKVIPI